MHIWWASWLFLVLSFLWGVRGVSSWRAVETWGSRRRHVGLGWLVLGAGSLTVSLAGLLDTDWLLTPAVGLVPVGAVLLFYGFLSRPEERR